MVITTGTLNSPLIVELFLFLIITQLRNILILSSKQTYLIELLVIHQIIKDCVNITPEYSTQSVYTADVWWMDAALTACDPSCSAQF